MKCHRKIIKSYVYIKSLSIQFKKKSLNFILVCLFNNFSIENLNHFLFSNSYFVPILIYKQMIIIQLFHLRTKSYNQITF